MRMRSMLVIGIVTVSLALYLESAAVAACRVKTEAVVAANVVAVPVAVSIGVPVREVAPYYYSYQAAVPQPAAVAVNEAAIDEIAARVVEKLRSPSGGGAVAAGPASAPHSNRNAESVPSTSLVAANCAKCHGGSDPKGNLSLENLAALNCETRLKAVRAVLSQKMPKGGPPLSPEEAGKVLEELVGGEK